MTIIIFWKQPYNVYNIQLEISDALSEFTIEFTHTLHRIIRSRKRTQICELPLN